MADATGGTVHPALASFCSNFQRPGKQSRRVSGHHRTDCRKAGFPALERLTKAFKDPARRGTPRAECDGDVQQVAFRSFPVCKESRSKKRAWRST